MRPASTVTALPLISIWLSDRDRMQPAYPHALTVFPLMRPLTPDWYWIPLNVKSCSVLLSTSTCGAVAMIGFPASSASPDANTPLSPPLNELWFTTTFHPATLLGPANTPVPAEPPVVVKSQLSTVS